MIKLISKKINTNIINILLITVYILIIVTCSYYHELWRDEARVWVFISNYDFITMLDNIRHDGHPYLWYFILYPFFKLHLPAVSMKFVSCFACISSVVLFLYKIEVGIVKKALFILSAGMIYFMPVLARNYSIVPLLAVIWLILYPKRKERPFLYLLINVLLSQTHMLMWGFCFISLLIFLVEIFPLLLKNKKYIYVVLLSVLYAVLIFFIYKDIFIEHRSFLDNFKNYNFFSQFKIYIWDSFCCHEAIKYMFIGTYIFLSVLLARIDFKLFVISLFSTIYILSVMFYIWGEGIRYEKIFLAVITFLMCCFAVNIKEKKVHKIFNYTLVIFLVLNLFSYSVIKVISEEIMSQYNNISEVCKIINSDKNGEKDFIVLNINPGFNDDNFIINIKNKYAKMLYIDPPFTYQEGIIDDKYIKSIIDTHKAKNVKYIIINLYHEINLPEDKYKILISEKDIKYHSLSYDEYQLLYKIKN